MREQSCLAPVLDTDSPEKRDKWVTSVTEWTDDGDDEAVNVAVAADAVVCDVVPAVGVEGIRRK